MAVLLRVFLRAKGRKNKKRSLFMKESYIKALGLFVLGVLFLVGSSANAASIPEGGSSFEEATFIEPGEYEEFNIEGDGELYYKLNVKAGQEVRADFQYKCHPDASRYHYYDIVWGLYDSNRTAVATDSFLADCNSSDFSSTEIAWMPNSDQSEYEYYLKIGCEKPGEGVNIKGLSISVTDYYDAQSQTDAGNSVTSAMGVEFGEYEGALSGESGSDKKDVYRVSIGSDKTLSARLVPPTDEILEVAVLNSDRKEIRKERSANKGAVVENNVPIYMGGDYYVSVSCREYPECAGITEYSLVIEEKEGISETLKEEVPPSEGGMPSVPEDIGEATRQMQESGEKASEALKEGIKGLIYYIVLPIAGGIVFLIVIIIVVVVVLKKRGKDEDGGGAENKEE